MKTKKKEVLFNCMRAGWVASVALTLLAGTILVGGCGKPKADNSASAVKSRPKYVDGSAVRKAFSNAGPDVKYVLDQQVGIAEAGGFADALPTLKKIAANAKMTPEQKQALTAFIKQIEAKMSGR